MSALPLYAGIALGIGAVFVLIFLVIAPVDRRVPWERRRAPGARDVSRLMKLTDHVVAAIDGAIRRRGRAPFGAAELEQAGVRMQPSGFILLVGSAAVALATVGLSFGFGQPWLIPLVIVLVALAPIGAKITLSVRASRRRAKFADQLDESLGLLAGGLRAGHSLLRSVDAVSQESESPTSEEFARVVNETRIGRDLGDAFENTAARMRSDDFRWIAQAIAINREVGGNLTQVLDQVAHTIRERNEIRRQVKALAAEGKLSAIILICLPVGVFVLLILIQPAYLQGFTANIIGIVALVMALILLVIGSLWMMAVIKVKF